MFHPWNITHKFQVCLLKILCQVDIHVLQTSLFLFLFIPSTGAMELADGTKFLNWKSLVRKMKQMMWIKEKNKAKKIKIKHMFREFFADWTILVWNFFYFIKITSSDYFIVPIGSVSERDQNKAFKKITGPIWTIKFSRFKVEVWVIFHA